MLPAPKIRITDGLGQCSEESNGVSGIALVALSHTPNEHQLYEAMSARVLGAGTRIGAFTMRNLKMLTGLNSYSTIRRALLGLQSKLSIEHYKVAGDQFLQSAPSVYFIFTPEEILNRRRAASMAMYKKGIGRSEGSIGFGSAINGLFNAAI